MSAPATMSSLFDVDVEKYFSNKDVLTIDNAKFKKSATGGVEAGAVHQIGLSLAPAKDSIQWNLCPGSSKGCRGCCLTTTARQTWPAAVKARLLRTRFLMEKRPAALAQIAREMGRERRKATAAGMKLAVRFNTLSDVDAVATFKSIMDPADQYLDYTKVAARYAKFLVGGFPANYHLTFSRSEENHATALDFVRAGGTATVVVADESVRDAMLANGWCGLPAVDGDLSDRRWQDKPGSWVVLIAKGRAKKDTSGFVVRSV